MIAEEDNKVLYIFKIVLFQTYDEFLWYKFSPPPNDSEQWLFVNRFGSTCGWVNDADFYMLRWKLCVLPLLVIYDGDVVRWDSQNCTAVKQFSFAQ